MAHNDDHMDNLHTQSDAVAKGMMKASPIDTVQGMSDVTSLITSMAQGDQTDEEYKKTMYTLMNLALIGHITVANVVGGSNGIKEGAERKRAEENGRDLPKGDGGLDFL